MIRDEAEFQEASKRLGVELRRLEEAGLGDTEIKRVIDPLESFHLQLREEVEAYEDEQTFPRKRIYMASRYTL